MINRRQILKKLSLASGMLFLPEKKLPVVSGRPNKFKFSLNTSTISGQKPDLTKYIEIASKAGYDSIELWIRDIRSHLDKRNSLKDLKKYIDDHGLTVENAIGFAPWLSFDVQKRKDGFLQMKDEMEMVSEIGCTRIAAPAAGIDHKIDLFMAGKIYGELIDLGRQTGVMPQLEFWGASQALYHIGQAMLVCAVANDPDVRILADVFHLYRGNSGFECLKMLSGNVLQVFHMNDFPGNIPRDEQTDKDRIYPGDGAAPMKEIIRILNNMEGEKILSIELFNETYWSQDPLLVAKTGLEKMKKLVAASI